MSDTPQWVKDLEAQPCKCVYCDACYGSGSIRVFFGRVSIDDLANLEECPSCNGRAITEVCDRCQQLEEWEQDRYE